MVTAWLYQSALPRLWRRAHQFAGNTSFVGTGDGDENIFF